MSENQIIWGGNYFRLPPTRGIVCWDKQQPAQTFSAWEFAWTSFNCPARIFRLANNALSREGRKIHPTQKPVALYRWLIQTFAKPGDRILDTHLGSGSSRIAAAVEGHDFVGIEKDPYYFSEEERRWEDWRSGGELFLAAMKTEDDGQGGLFE